MSRYRNVAPLTSHAHAHANSDLLRVHCTVYSVQYNAHCTRALRLQMHANWHRGPARLGSARCGFAWTRRVELNMNMNMSDSTCLQ